MQITLGLTLLLGLLAAVGPISTDIYLPAFATIDHEFGRAGAGQITLAVWFIGLAAGQLIQGSLSDRIGRRRPLFYATLIYTAASIGCALAPGLWSFSGFRLLAALSGSASMVIPRAIIRDVAEGYTAARLLSRLTLVLGVVPVIAPAIGGAMLVFMSWRDLFWAAGLYGVACTLLVWRFLPDTLPPQRRLHHTVAQTVSRYLHVARERVFVTNVLQLGFAFAGLFAYISGSAVVYTEHFRLTPGQYGLLFGFNATGMIAMSQAASYLAGRFGLDRLLHVASVVMLGSVAVAALDAFTGLGRVAGIAAPIYVAQAMYGLMSPLTTVSALVSHRGHAGTASALMGTWQFTLGAAAAVTMGLIGTSSPRPMAIVMVACAGLVVLMDRLRPAITFDI